MQQQRRWFVGLKKLALGREENKGVESRELLLLLLLLLLTIKST